MSSSTDVQDNDLIDFAVGSPEVTTSPLQDVSIEVSDHLLDSELPVLEQKLQTSATVPLLNHNEGIDVEDILITIDEGDVTSFTPKAYLEKPIRRNKDDVLSDVRIDEIDVPIDDGQVLDHHQNGHLGSSEQCRNFTVIKNLSSNQEETENDARVLENRHVLRSNSSAFKYKVHEDTKKISENEFKANSVDSELLSVLEQLDQVLDESLEQNSDFNVSYNTSGCPVNVEGSVTNNESGHEDEEIDEELVRAYLMELDNYLKMLDSSDCSELPEDFSGLENLVVDENGYYCRGLPINANGYNNPEQTSETQDINEQATVSLGFTGRPLFMLPLRKAASVRFPRPEASSKGTEALQRNHRLRSTVSVVSSRPHESAAHQNDSAPIPITPSVPTAGGQEGGTESHLGPPEMAGKESSSSSSWLRSSMRRLRHFRLPSDSAPGQSEVVEVAEVAEEREEVVARPVSAPSRLPAVANAVPEVVSGYPGGRVRSNSSSSRSRRHRSPSSSESSVATTVDTTPSCTPTPTPMRSNEETPAAASGRRSCDRPRNDIPEAESPLGHWPHSLSSMLACLSCSLGLFNICRFAILSIHFGANFIFQFLILSMVIGLPMFTLQLCLGQQLGAGVIDMWRISPLFQGVGVSLLASQALIGLYSITGVSWMFVYFRDSFITKMDKYRWAEPFYHYRREQSLITNGSFKLSDTVPDYLSGVVYQRTNLMYGNIYGTIKFQPAFNLAVVWMIVFVSLSKGLRSYGKVIYVFTLLPVFATFIMCAKLLGMMPPEFIHIVFPETSWSEFFLNPRSWLAAGQEVFLTWGLLGAAVMQLASHNKNKHLLQRDSSLIAVLTFSILILVAFLANTCVQILRSYGYTYQPNSFEKLSTYSFLRSTRDPLPPNLASTPLRYMVHNSYILGEKVIRPGMDTTSESGYQVLRFATELVPATFALLGSEKISPFWAVLFYFILILFGIAQQLAIWHCVITGIMAIKAKVLKSWETTITFFSCACGFILGLPMTTELGVYVVYFLDVTVGGSWWLILVILLQIIAVFMVRGRPYSGDTVVTALFKSSPTSYLFSWAPALLSFVWNVILPVLLMVFCVVFFKNGNFRELFVWHHAPSIEYWPLWARQIGSMIQLLPVLCVPIVAVIQSYRYLNNGPPDILDRIQYLYRPPLGEHMDDLAIQEAAAATILATAVVSEVRAEDPPPKYTPPPSYTTATGARLAKLLRQSIRRSVRRIRDVLGEGSSRQQTSNNNNNAEPVPPPDYNAVLVEMNQTPASNDVPIYVTDSSNLGSQRAQESPSRLTPSGVASLLRNSFRRSTARAANSFRRNITSDFGNSSLSAENLVDSAAPIGETSLVLEQINRQSDDKCVNNNSSVI